MARYLMVHLPPRLQTLTWLPSRAHNRNVLWRRRVVGFWVLLSLLVVPSAAPCAGWMASEHARMACCAGAHDGSTQASADSCCAAGEQRHNTDTAGVGHISAPPPATALLFSTAPQVVLFDVDAGRHTPRPLGAPPTHVLLSVFLI